MPVRIRQEIQTLPRPGRLSGADAFGAATTRADALDRIADAFRRAALEDPMREARIALCAACGISRVELIVAPEGRLGASAHLLEQFVARRSAGEPLSKIVGRREFWGLSLAVSPDVLDPRAETETIVETAIALLIDRRRSPLRVLDLGVGSGAILCALLEEFPNARGVGVDVCADAAAIARNNLEAHGFAERGEIRVGCWTDGLEGPFNLIVSNPPYIPSADIDALGREVRSFDPRLALDGGPDGLDAYRAIVPASPSLLQPDGWLLLEVGPGQAADVLALVTKAKFASCEVRRDLTGNERVVVARAADGGDGVAHSRPGEGHGRADIGR